MLFFEIGSNIPVSIIGNVVDKKYFWSQRAWQRRKMSEGISPYFA